MAIPFDQLPFEVVFSQYGEIKRPRFYTTEKEAYTEQVLQRIKENVDLQLDFRCANEDARFYMDGLDALPERYLEIDEHGEAYKYPCSRFAIFKENYYPLIPGQNLITVVLDEQSYYSLVEIVPTQLSTFEWKYMISELEEILNGLSMDLIRKNIALGEFYHKSIPPVLLYRFMVIKKSFPNVMAALSDLLTKINSRIKKEYNMVPNERAKTIDSVTIRYRSTHPENSQFLKVPKPIVDYDLPENRWIKKIIRILIQYLNDFMDATEEFKGELESEITRLDQWSTNELVIAQKRKVIQNLSTYGDVSVKMKKGLDIIKQAPWYAQVSDLNPTTISSVLLSDSRYFALFKLYKELQREEFDVSIDPAYSYQYKRTDKLYEIWGFLQMCEAVKELGYEPRSGWIYDRDFDSEHILIPTLPSGSKITFAKDDLELRMTYDGELPYESSKTSPDNPIYAASSKNTPDGRIDVYKAGIYIGTLIFDMKCRNLNNFFHDSYLKSAYRSPAVAQLISYATQCRSLYIFGHHKRSQDIYPVREVWAIHPKSSDSSNHNKLKKDHKLRLLKLAPAEGIDVLVKQLNIFISEILEWYEDMLKGFGHTNME